MLIWFIMNEKNIQLAKGLVPENYLLQGQQSLSMYNNAWKEILASRKLPQDGWNETMIEYILQQLSLMDTNNFLKNVGVGEREARVFSSMVERRHYRLCHGIGRSGDVAAIQPKAAGSSLLVQIANILVQEMIQIAGIRRIKLAIVIPVATGMALALSLLTLHQKKPQAKYVLWSRIDQKSCLKSIMTANLTPIVVPIIKCADALMTDLKYLEELVLQYGQENILCIMSTTSCFAPRTPDKVIEIAELCQKYDIGHIINNAYGLQSSKITHNINEAFRRGRVDVCVQSTDKNFLVPVGGSVVCGVKKDFIQEIGKMYPGRANNAPIMDIFITALQMGRNGYKQLLNERKELSKYFHESLSHVVQKHGERILETKPNEISYAITLNTMIKEGKDDSSKITYFGSMLFTRGVSGSRVVSCVDTKTIGNLTFQGYGAHYDKYPLPYFTVACAIGISKKEIDLFVSRLDQIMTEFTKESQKIQVASA